MKSYQAFQDAPGAPQNVSETAKSNLNSCGYRVFGELGSPWEAFWTPLGPLGGILDPQHCLNNTSTSHTLHFLLYLFIITSSPLTISLTQHIINNTSTLRFAAIQVL